MSARAKTQESVTQQRVRGREAVGAPASSVTLRVFNWFARGVDGWSLRTISAAGLTATVLIAIGSFGAGALPASDLSRKVPVLGLLRHGALGLHVALGFYYVGLALLVVTWLILGRTLLTGSSRGVSSVSEEVVAPTALRRMLIVWMIPLLVGMPLASMDLYSYAAQAQLSQSGFDPYTATPADLPGKFLDNVAWKWVDTPSPYGPGWVIVSRLAADITGNHAFVSVLLLRLIPFAAMVVIALLLPGLARRFTGRGDLALWIAVANPLVLVHGVGGGHNDAVMMMFIVAAMAVVLRPEADWRHLAAGAALAALAASVKAPGFVAVAFVVPIYFIGRPGNNAARLRACVIAAAFGVATFAAVTAASGVGLGWTKQLSNAYPVISFISLPTLAAVIYRASIGAPHAASVVDQTVRNFRTVGSVVGAALLVYLWFRAFNHRAVSLFALALLSLVLLGPSVQPWYFTWALTIVALVLLRPTGIFWLAAVSIGLTLFIRPMGSALEMVPLLIALIATALLCRALLGPVVQQARTPVSEPG